MQNTEGSEKKQAKLLDASARPPLSRSITNTLSPGRSEIFLQAKKNTILTSHGRPPWYVSRGTFKNLSDLTLYQVQRGWSSSLRRVRDRYRW